MPPPDEPLTVDVFLDRLDIGEYDDRLKEIRTRILARQIELEERFMRSLAPGDTLIFNENVSPRYLQGKEVHFLNLERTKKGQRVRVQASWDKSLRRYMGEIITCSPRILYKKEST